MKSIMQKEVKIGLLVIVALAVLFFGINFLKGINLFKAANYYYCSYTNVEGLTQSAPVTVNGFKAGIVRNISYDFAHPGNVIVELSVDKSLRIPKESKAVLTSDLLGTASIALILGDSNNGFLAVGDTVEGTINPGLMAGISENLMPSVNSIMPKVDSLLSNLNKITANPALHQSIDRLDDITAQLEATIKALHATSATLPPIANNVVRITENVDTLTNDLAQVSGRMREVPVDSMARTLEETLANLNELTKALNSPDGTVGKLTQDPELYNNINSTISSLDSLFVDIKRNPKRYINVKVF